MVERLGALLSQLWSQVGVVEVLMTGLPFIPLLFYMWVVHQFRKTGQITDTYNTADKVAFTIYLISIPLAIFIHLYFKLGPFVSFFIVWGSWALLIYLFWKFMRFMAAREQRLRKIAQIERQTAIQRENRRRRGYK